jgi:hypothetical protein
MRPILLNAAHFDIISQLRATIRSSPVRWVFRHVKGHAKGPFLSRWEKLNVAADALCKQFWERAPILLDQRIHVDEWAVWVGEHKVCSAFSSTVSRWRQCQSASRYWERRAGVRATELVDWEATAGAMRLLPRHRQVWISKQGSGMCASSMRMWAQGQRATAMCPRCPLDEDSEHVLCCRGVGTEDLWQRHMTSLGQWLRDADTAPAVAADLIAGLTQWRVLSPGQKARQAELRASDSLPPISHRRRYMRDQYLIGWRAALEGRLAVDWRMAQARFWLRHGCLKSVHRWASSLVLRLLQISWDFWDHRNHILHGTEVSLADFEMDSRIQVLHSQGISGVPPHCHSLFRIPLQHLLRHPRPFKMDWLTVVETGRAALLRLHPPPAVVR